MTNFDKHIKEALGNLSQNYVPDDWLAMNHLLTDTSFDKTINQKINLHEETITEAELQLFDNFLTAKALDTFVQGKFELIEAAEMEPDWDDFSQKLTDYTFDNQINNKISEIDAEIPAADWAVFEQKLTENAFDTQVREKIAEHISPYRSSDWRAMRRLLEGLSPQRNYIWEKAKKLLPFFLLFLIVGGGATWYANSADEKAVEITSTAQSSLATEKEESKNEPSLNKNENTQNQALATHSDVIKGLPQSKNTKVKTNISPKKEMKKPVFSEKTLPVFTEIKEISASQNADVPAVAKNIIVANEISVSPKTENINPDKNLSSTNEREINTKIAIQKAGYAQFILPQTQKSHAIQCQIKEMTFDNWNPNIAIGLYSAVLGNVVELNDTFNIGTSLGLRTELSLNEKWSLTTDVLYSKRSFETQYYKLYRPTNAYLQHLLIGSLASIDIPIMVKRKWNLDKKGKWDFYVQAGGVPSITLRENYTHYDPTTIENLGKNWGANLREMTPVEQSFHFKPYMGNVIFAPGVQYTSGRLRLQAEPRFQWAIQPVSVESKTLHSLGFGVSAIYQLYTK